jgi:flavin reductase (DIM6/NTAB) family NADH-FMN oxidoreductase RutF
MTQLEQVFDRLVAGIDYSMFIVTAAVGDSRAGCLVGFVTQASIDPPRLLVMLSKANETYRVARRAEVLIVHFLEVGNHDLAEVFGGLSGDWSDKFAHVDWTAGAGGAPVLRGVRGWVAGRVIDRFDAGDHVAHLLEPIGAGEDVGGPPLMFQQVGDIDPGHPA